MTSDHRPLSARDILPPAIAWHEGMLLAPQHFQQLALRGEGLAAYHALCADPLAWGVRSVRFAAIEENRLTLERLDAVMPDGLIAKLVSQRLLIELTDEHEPLIKSGKALVFVTVAKAQTTAGPYSSSAAADDARYHQVPGLEVADENGDATAGTVVIPRLQPHLKLFVGAEPPAEYTALPVARLERGGKNNELRFGSFLPPLLDFSGAIHFGTEGDIGQLVLSWCDKIRIDLQNKRIGLASTLAGRPAAAAEPVSDEAPYRALQTKMLLLETRQHLQAVTAGLPLFEAVLRSQPVRPYPLYLALCNLLGSLSHFGGPGSLDGVPIYHHARPGQAFEALLKRVGDLLLAGGEPTGRRAFEASDPRADGRYRRFVLQLQPEWVRDDAVYIEAEPVSLDSGRSFVERGVIDWAAASEATHLRRARGFLRQEANAQQISELGLAGFRHRGRAIYRVEMPTQPHWPGEPKLEIRFDDGFDQVVLYTGLPKVEPGGLPTLVEPIIHAR